MIIESVGIRKFLIVEKEAFPELVVFTIGENKNVIDVQTFDFLNSIWK